MAAFDDMSPGLVGISKKPFAVTPSDATDFTTPSRYFQVGVAGTVAVVRMDGTVVSYTVPAGGYIFSVAKRVNATGTTASSIVGHE